MFTNVTVDLLVDLSQTAFGSSATRDMISALVRPDGLGAITGRSTCILPPGMEVSEASDVPHWRFAPAAEALVASTSALQSAARLQRPLAVVLRPILSGSEPISALVEALSVDPMFGFAIPRVQDRQGNLAKLSACLGDPEIACLPRALLGILPDRYIVPEVIGACFVVRSEVVSNFGDLDSHFENTTGAWWHYLCRARRVGFRGVIVNRSVVNSVAGADEVTLCASAEDYWNAHRQFPDVEFARQEFRGLPAHEYESLLARTFSKDESKQKTLLVDARGLPPFFNGTADCILGLMQGLAECATDWRIGVLVKSEASVFHHISERFPRWTFFENIPKQRYSIALRLSQPWEIQTLVELHALALFNFYLMLDTISWDILYNGPLRNELESTWEFVAEHADGLLYISDYTRQRFAMRFRPSPSVRHYVSYLPFHQDDYLEADVPPLVEGEYLLVVGNNLDHKWVAPTVEVLATAFPFHAVWALGCGSVNLPNVNGIRSGDLSDIEAARLYAGAKIIVFPSFYEGFGLPVLTGLSYGKAVVARRSSLLDELAARCRATGRLYAFSDTMELLEIVARLLRGDNVTSMPLGGALEDSQEPMRWRDIAENMIDFMKVALGTPSQSQWLRRLHQIRMCQRTSP
jgi:glycosyltransferase involved in cell wall biosynthesis